MNYGEGVLISPILCRVSGWPILKIDGAKEAFSAGRVIP